MLKPVNPPENIQSSVASLPFEISGQYMPGFLIHYMIWYLLTQIDYFFKKGRERIMRKREIVHIEIFYFFSYNIFNMGRCTDRRDMTKAVESGIKLQANKQTNNIFKFICCKGMKCHLYLQQTTENI